MTRKLVSPETLNPLQRCEAYFQDAAQELKLDQKLSQRLVMELAPCKVRLEDTSFLLEKCRHDLSRKMGKSLEPVNEDVNDEIDDLKDLPRKDDSPVEDEEPDWTRSRINAWHE